MCTKVEPFRYTILRALKDDYFIFFTLLLLEAQIENSKIEKENEFSKLKDYINNFKNNALSALSTDEIAFFSKLLGISNADTVNINLKRIDFIKNEKLINDIFSCARTKQTTTYYPLIEWCYLNDIQEVFNIQNINEDEDDIDFDLIKERQLFIGQLFSYFYKIFNAFFDKKKKAPKVTFELYGECKDSFSLTCLNENYFQKIKNIFEKNENFLSQDKAFFFQGTSNLSALCGYIAESTNSYLVSFENNQESQVDKKTDGCCRYSIVKFDPPIKPFAK